MPKNIPSLHRRPNRHDPLYLFFQTMVPSLIHLNDSTVFISHCNRTLSRLERPFPTENQSHCPKPPMSPNPSRSCFSRRPCMQIPKCLLQVGFLSKFSLPNKKMRQRIVRTRISPKIVHQIHMVKYSLRFLSSRLQIVDKEKVFLNTIPKNSRPARSCQRNRQQQCNSQ